jgi:hypothetical protein
MSYYHIEKRSKELHISKSAANGDKLSMTLICFSNYS